jgi:hypothetical protein
MSLFGNTITCEDCNGRNRRCETCGGKGKVPRGTQFRRNQDGSSTGSDDGGSGLLNFMQSLGGTSSGGETGRSADTTTTDGPSGDGDGGGDGGGGGD